MQFKPIPAPPAESDPIATIEAVRTALPPDPDPDLDCCARVMAETVLDTREEAADWLTFLRALELAVEEPDGYRREPIDGDLEPERLTTAFRQRLVGAGSALDAVETANEPVTAETIFETLEASDAIPRSARHRHDDRLESRWTNRIERILAWAETFGLVERVDGGYR